MLAQQGWFGPLPRVLPAELVRVGTVYVLGDSGQRPQTDWCT